MRRGVLIGLVATTLPLGAAVVFDRLAPPDLSRFRDTSLEILARDGAPLRTFLTHDGMLRLETSVDAVDLRYSDLLVQTEDKRFWYHPGFDPLAMARALWQWARHGHVVSGTSTLTMQVARLLTPHRHDLPGKLADIARAVQLEWRLSKLEILQLYLTLAPMGGNREGVRAGAWTYFNQEPNRLSPAQAALLVAIPQSPERLRPDRSPAAATAAIVRLCARKRLPCGEVPIHLPTITAKQPPVHAHHLADALRRDGRSGRVRTTLDGPLQAALERTAAREARFLGDHANIATLVIDNDDRSALAYLGGVNYFGPAGMVDMIRAVRSPGSTLKPFIYGLAFDGGSLRPESLIEDRPIRFGDYAPRGLDGAFHGSTTARKALQQSYNAPAVQLLEEVGAAKVAAKLRLSGARLSFPRGTAAPGLPIALGGVGITLGDLATLYAGLANEGQPATLRLLPDAPFSETAPLMTATSARMITAILRGVAPPEGVAPPHYRALAYKTGTSYGFRDAVAVGYSERYTVAVWVGRTEGTPRPGAYGRNTAAPLLFTVFDLLPPEAAPSSSERPLPIAGATAPGLRRFMPNKEPIGLAARRAATTRITFPPSGSRLDLARNGRGETPLALEATGGAPPYRWIVNGHPLPPVAVGAPTLCLPDGPGLVRISVIDRNNETASAEAWVN